MDTDVVKPCPRLVNLTAHTVTIHPVRGEAITIQPSGTVARLQTSVRDRHEEIFEGFEDRPVIVYRKDFGRAIDLPAPVPGTIFIVSAMLVEAFPERLDLRCPGDFSYDEYGRKQGCRALCLPG